MINHRSTLLPSIHAMIESTNMMTHNGENSAMSNTRISRKANLSSMDHRRKLQVNYIDRAKSRIESFNQHFIQHSLNMDASYVWVENAQVQHKYSINHPKTIDDLYNATVQIMLNITRLLGQYKCHAPSLVQRVNELNQAYQAYAFVAYHQYTHRKSIYSPQSMLSVDDHDDDDERQAHIDRDHARQTFLEQQCQHQLDQLQLCVDRYRYLYDMRSPISTTIQLKYTSPKQRHRRQQKPTIN